MICRHHPLVLNRRRFITNANPLRVDPTRTTTIRKRFIADMNRRFKKLKAALKEFLDEDDALGLRKFTTRIILHAEREFQFRTDAGKLQAFNDWFKQQIDASVLSVPSGSDPTRPWTAQYVESAYKKGQVNAYAASKEGLSMADFGVGEQTQEQFLRSSFSQPETVSKVQLLATRSFEDLKGVTATMSSQMNRILAQGLVDGTGPEALAKEMSSAIDDLTSKRALVIARTEVIAAHAEGQLDAFDKLGVEELGVKAEWSTAGDDRVCPECAEMEGQVFDIEEARGMIPLHPNCRCTWIPAGAALEPKPQEEAKPVEPAWDHWNDSASMVDSISKEERDVLQDYTADSSVLNGPLRGGGSLSPRVIENRDAIDSIFEKAPPLPEDVMVYRALDKTTFESIRKGDTILDSAYLSTSVSKSAHKQILEEIEDIGDSPMSLRITVPAGTQTLKLDAVTPYFADQDELLLPRNSKLTITKITGNTVEAVFSKK